MCIKVGSTLGPTQVDGKLDPIFGMCWSVSLSLKINDILNFNSMKDVLLHFKFYCNVLHLNKTTSVIISFEIVKRLQTRVLKL